METQSRTWKGRWGVRLVGRLTGRAAIVTGATGGMGRAACAALASEGAAVIVADIVDDPGETRAAELVGTAAYQRLDVADLSGWEASRPLPKLASVRFRSWLIAPGS